MGKIKEKIKEEVLGPEVTEIRIQIPAGPSENVPDTDFFPHADDGQMAKYQKPRKPKIRR
jgi:hypothetical protein